MLDDLKQLTNEKRHGLHHDTFAALDLTGMELMSNQKNYSRNKFRELICEKVSFQAAIPFTS
jgi:hypothetical protein